MCGWTVTSAACNAGGENDSTYSMLGGALKAAGGKHDTPNHLMQHVARGPKASIRQPGCSVDEVPPALHGTSIVLYVLPG